MTFRLMSLIAFTLPDKVKEMIRCTHYHTKILYSIHSLSCMMCESISDKKRANSPMSHPRLSLFEPIATLQRPTDSLMCAPSGSPSATSRGCSGLGLGFRCWHGHTARCNENPIPNAKNLAYISLCYFWGLPIYLSLLFFNQMIHNGFSTILYHTFDIQYDVSRVLQKSVSRAHFGVCFYYTRAVSLYFT